MIIFHTFVNELVKFIIFLSQFEDVIDIMLSLLNQLILFKLLNLIIDIVHFVLVEFGDGVFVAVKILDDMDSSIGPRKLGTFDWALHWIGVSTSASNTRSLRSIPNNLLPSSIAPAVVRDTITEIVAGLTSYHDGALFTMVIDDNVLICYRHRLVIIVHHVWTCAVVFSVLALASHMFLGLIFHEAFLVVSRIVKIISERHVLVVHRCLKFTTNFFLLLVDCAILGTLHRSDSILGLSNIRRHLAHLAGSFLHAIRWVGIIILVLRHSHVDSNDIF